MADIVDENCKHSNCDFVTFVTDFAVYAAIGLLVDRVAFSELRRLASSSRAIKDSSYISTLFPRITPMPIGAALSAYAPGPDVDVLNLTGLALLVTPVLLLCVSIIRQWYTARPRR